MNNDFFNLVNFWQAIRIYGWWQVGIELLIIGLFVYSIMRFLRGTRINADLSAAMLNTIFWPNSPLHDLGVIVSQGRIMYAGVQFPLAESGDLERELGSRHRAAVGMSQESDAVVLVVSEQTGDISIADRGQLLRRLSGDQLRTILSELLGGKQQPKKVMKAAALL